ncbi:MAG: nucleotidyltransferase domain-containing protein [Candidatus Absconditabacterales bacterium]
MKYIQYSIIKPLLQFFIKTKHPPHSYSPELTQVIKDIVSLHVPAETTKIFLFGSRASGKNTKHSDYDIGIVANNPLSATTLREIQKEIGHIMTTQCHITDFTDAPEEEKQRLITKKIIEI